MRHSLTLQELEAFIDLAHSLSFRLTAQRRHVSQPALSRTIAQAEAKLGVRLFERSTRHVALTSAGLELLPAARRIVTDVGDSLDDLSAFVSGQKGRITIACLPAIAAAILPEPMQAFLEIHPAVSIALESVSAADVLNRVADGTAHFGVSTQTYGGGPQQIETLDFAPLLADELLLICASTSPLVSAREARWTVLKDYPLIANGPASSVKPLVEQVLQEQRIHLTPRYESINLSVTVRMVAAGLGVAIIPSSARQLVNMQGVHSLPLVDPVVSRSIGIISRRGRPLAGAARLFVEQFVRPRHTRAERPVAGPGPADPG